MTSAPGEEALDGLKVDQRGNLYVSGPGGVWILSPDGQAPRHDHGARASRQLRLGRRRRPHALPDGADGAVSHPAERRGHPAMTRRGQGDTMPLCPRSR